MKPYVEQSDRQRVQSDERLRADRWRATQDDLRRLMSEPWGRRLAHWIVHGLAAHGGADGLSGPYDSAFDGDIKDGLCTALHSFRRMGASDLASKFHRILMETTPEMVPVMVIEDAQAAQAELRSGSPNHSAGDSE